MIISNKYNQKGTHSYALLVQYHVGRHNKVVFVMAAGSTTNHSHACSHTTKESDAPSEPRTLTLHVAVRLVECNPTSQWE